MMTGTDLARYACDYCRQKKFRCTREFPKCRACKPWPGPCNYSRDIPDTSTSSITTTIIVNTQKTDDVQLRLQNIEKSIQNLTDVVNKAVTAMKEVSSACREKDADHQTTTADTDDQAPILHVGKQNSFSVLQDAESSVRRATGSLSSSLHQSATNELQFLTSSLTTAVADTQLRGDSYYIPRRSEGYQLIGKFLEHVCLGDAFFIAPSEELLIQVIFKPESVQRKAWIVFVNYMLLAMLSEVHNTEAQGFRHNVKLALNDSRIFLEPHQVHLQTLILLAIHGEDYASPSIVWVLVGHACRQAEALGLHLSDNSDFETHQRQLSLFWMLFAVDKSCSLAFGRPCFIPSAIYAKVPLPDLGHLTRFQPRSDPGSDTNRKGQSSIFGAHMFLARMELARLTGSVLDMVTSEAERSKRDQLKANLTDWNARTNQMLDGILNTERAASSPNQLREMSLGISTMNFEYLHVWMVLTRADASCVGSRLEAARKAISLLPSMVSNWMSIYNPMTWHLLYFPFIPFFIIFENLVQDHASLTATANQQDIELLSTTVSYYSSLREQFQLLAPLCGRLKTVATVFHRLALVQVGLNGTLEQDKTPSQSFHASEGQTMGFLDSDTTVSFEQMQVQLGDEIGVDLKQYLEWLSTDISPVQCESLGDMPTGNLADEMLNSFPVGMQEKDPRGTKRPFDVMFDWFSWDNC